MQNAYLITSKGYTEKQAGVMFFVFGMSQFLFQTPAGYLMDYSRKKVLLLGISAVGTTLLTLITAAFASEDGGNIGFMIFVKFLQGAVTALIPPGLNSITQGIVGTVGMTTQVSKNGKCISPLFELCAWQCPFMNHDFYFLLAFFCLPTPRNDESSWNGYHCAYRFLIGICIVP